MSKRFNHDEEGALLQIVAALTADRMGDDDTFDRLIAEAPDPRLMLAGLLGLTQSMLDALERAGLVVADEFLQQLAAGALGAGPR